ncbi:unnamed protein product [Orchesella dallaii]|uniref:Uncharacterized protein n=1 Tax=Orchesella dallaii TaxID=48710 RepID=A0ABP1RZX8_9HEXA
MATFQTFFSNVRRVFQKIIVTPKTNWKYFESLQSKFSSRIPMYAGVKGLDSLAKGNQNVKDWAGKFSSVLAAIVQVLFKNFTLTPEDPEGGAVFQPITKTIAATEIMYNSNDDATHFITCAPTQVPGFLSLLGYISAFDLGTWLMLLATGLGSGLFLRMILWEAHKVSEYDWYSATFVLNVLLGQGTRVIHVSRWVGGCWIMSGMVITCFTKGKISMGLTAPLQLKSMETFEELMQSNLTIYSVESNRILLDEIEYLASYEDKRGSKYGTRFRRDYKKKWSKVVDYWVLFTQLYYFNHRNMTMKQVFDKLAGRLIPPKTYYEMVQQLNKEYHLNIIKKWV